MGSIRSSLFCQGEWGKRSTQNQRLPAYTPHIPLALTQPGPPVPAWSSPPDGAAHQPVCTQVSGGRLEEEEGAAVFSTLDLRIHLAWSSQLFGMGIFSVILRKMELQGDWTLMRIQPRVGPDKDGAVPSPPPPLTHSRSEEKILEFWTRSPVVLLLCWEKPFILFTGLN